MRKKEIRGLTNDFEVRSENDSTSIVGYALKFNKWSEDLGGFREIISPHALDKCDMADVRCLIDHDSGKILGRTLAGNLELTVDEIGLRFKCTPTQTTYSKDLIVNMQSGNINQCSFSFDLNWDDEDCSVWEWNEGSQIYERTINNISQIGDVSIVTFPAYSDTECVVAKRHLEQLTNELKNEQRKKSLTLELELLKIKGVLN